MNSQSKILEVVLKVADKLTPGLKTAATKGSAHLQRIGNAVKKMGSRFKAAVFNVKGLIAAFLGLVIIRKAVTWMKQAIEAAALQEEAVTALNAALTASGNYSEEASKGLQQYASSLQKLLGIADEVTLETMGMIEGLTKLSADALPKAMKAIVQISTLYKVDYKASAILLGKTLSSTLNAFSRYGIQVDMTADSTERLDQIVKGTEAGWLMAIEKTNTFAGSMTILHAGWGDFMEKIGDWVAESPGVIALLKVMVTWVDNLADSVDEAKDSSEDLVGKGFAAVVKGGLSVVKRVAQIVWVLRIARTGIKDLAIGMATGVKWILESWGKLADVESRWKGTIFDEMLRDFGIEIGDYEKGGKLQDTINAITADIKEMKEELGDLHVGTIAVADFINEITQAQLDIDQAIADSAGTIVDDYIPVTNNATDAVEDLTNALAGKGGLADALMKVAGAMQAQAPFLPPGPEGLFEEYDAWVAAGKPYLGPKLPRRVKGYHYGPDDPLAFSLMKKQWWEKPALGWPAYEDDYKGPFTLDPAMPGFSGDMDEMMDEMTDSFMTNLEDNWQSLLAAGMGGAASGGFGGAMQSILPAIGMMIPGLGPLGGAIGGLLGGLFGKKKRGETPSQPVYVRDPWLESRMTDLLNVTKSMLTSSAGAGIAAIDRNLYIQAGRVGAT